MVNTRRSESSGAAKTNGHRYRTRRSNPIHVPVLTAFCASDSSEGGEDESVADAESAGAESSSSKEKDKRGKPADLPASVRELRKRYNRIELINRKSERRRQITMYNNIRNRLDSDDDCYSPRPRCRGYKAHLNQFERRSALSLRPITRKFYKDASPETCLADDKLRRSKRNIQPINSSWLTEDQHKVGYPVKSGGYSDEDSRDVHDQTTSVRRNNMETNRRPQRIRNRNNMYTYYSYHDERNLDERRPLADCDNLRTRSGAHGVSKQNSRVAESKSDNVIHGRSSRLRKSKTDENVEATNGEENGKEEAVSDDDKEDEEAADIKENGENDKADEVDDDKRQRVSTESDERPLVRTRNANRRMVVEPANRERKTSESSSSSEAGPKVYSLRDRSAINKRHPLESLNTRRTTRGQDRTSFHRRRRFRRRQISTTSSSSDSSDSDDARRKNTKYNKNAKSPHSKNEQLKSGAGGSKISPIGPDVIDPKITFDAVGGLDEHVQCLKEMVLLPMMYPEIFQRFHVHPPRGVLFHGPPGTGKTLIARALANECSFGTRKVAFFMRKGADLLSKWVGESEKQLRTLFEQASEMKPSIIFFDELDGLAPVRSSRQDQIHASIVSTLLALMDGLNNRGEVIVIGATNRIDAIDPALRRPGRFDRELFFPLPARTEREEILKVHVSQWSTPPSDQLISYLAESAAGYCGSDLRALCSEAVVQSLRRTYPQVYSSNHRLLLDPEKVKVEKLDFLRARSQLVPASQRISQKIGRKLLPVVEPLLSKPLEEVLEILGKSFPHGSDARFAKVKLSAAVRPAQLLLVGDGPHHGLTTHLAPAILQSMEHVHAHVLDMSTMHENESPEQTCIHVFREAKRSIPSVIYIPNIDTFWSLTNETVQAIFTQQLEQLDPHSPILILATANSLHAELPQEIIDIFSDYRGEVYDISRPPSNARLNFFRPLLVDTCLKPPRSTRDREYTPPPLQRAPTPPPEPVSEKEMQKLYEEEEVTLRELRIFLRDMCKKLASNKLFFMFTKPVDTEEVPDYTNIIKQPMDLETMMTKVDFHRYECAKDFLNDIELICHNALEYNPARSSADKQIRHRACSLRDYAFSLIKNEMDTDFEDKCRDISKKRKERGEPAKDYRPAYLDTPEDDPKPATADQNSSVNSNTSPPRTQQSLQKVTTGKKRRFYSWQHGYINKKKKIRLSHNISEAIIDDQQNDQSDTIEENSNTPPATSIAKPSTPTILNSPEPMQSSNESPVSPRKRRLIDLFSPSELLGDLLDCDDVQAHLNESGVKVEQEPVRVSEEDLESVLHSAVSYTAQQCVQPLLDLRCHLAQIVKKYANTHDRMTLPKELQKELNRFKDRSNP